MKRMLGILLLVGLVNVSSAVTLNVPPRPADALSGSEFKNSIENLPTPDRENAILSAVTSGNIPDFLRNLVVVTVTTTINGKNHTATYYVIPDYLAIGSDSDYFLIPLTPLAAQRVADLLKCNLPTRKMVDEIANAAVVKLPPSPIPPSPKMVTVPVFWDENTIVRQERADFLKSNPLGSLVVGDKKDVVVTARLSTSTTSVAIYGWHYPNGRHIQPLYLGHGDHYADYSHGIRLVNLMMTVDDIPTTVPMILQDPILNVLLSDEGVVSTYRYNVPLPCQ